MAGLNRKEPWGSEFIGQSGFWWHPAGSQESDICPADIFSCLQAGDGDEEALCPYFSSIILHT
ncbi:hypothetical protein EYF80_016646 [Liparis tanakae]|uniref:Uncharacterized protein n=1 Tax=Liparis tanakae TaxID=230148 RepID=A0A4Z2I5R7_9TELE|nr:hypothetical protein EYF80_016646 [Liparis tanakae]